MSDSTSRRSTNSEYLTLPMTLLRVEGGDDVRAEAGRSRVVILTRRWYPAALGPEPVVAGRLDIDRRPVRERADRATGLGYARKRGLVMLAWSTWFRCVAEG